MERLTSEQLEQIKAQYPEEKPYVFNYHRARNDIFYMAAEIDRLNNENQRINDFESSQCAKLLAKISELQANLERQMAADRKEPCRYCDNHKMSISGYYLMNTEINETPIKINVLKSLLNVNLNGIGAACKIKFCPMCGRELET